MIIKSFTAPTVAAALKKIREEMGHNAVVLKTTVLSSGDTSRSGKNVEITACIDESALTPGQLNGLVKAGDRSEEKSVQSTRIPDVTRSLSDAGEPEKLAAQLGSKLDSILNSHSNTEPLSGVAPGVRPIYLDMLDADIPSDIVDQIAAKIDEAAGTDGDAKQPAQDVLKEYLKGMIASDINFEPGMKVVFAGPSGAGKTSAMAKLAAQLTSFRKLKVTLSSLDDMKVSAYEEIGSYADILNLPVEIFDQLADRERLDSVVLIDTPSMPCDAARRDNLFEKIRALKPDIVFLVFSACCRTRDLLDRLNHFEDLAPSYLIAGHLDETERWGTIPAMTGFLDIPLAYTMNSPGGMGLLKIADADMIARNILKMEVADAGQ